MPLDKRIMDKSACQGVLSFYCYALILNRCFVFVELRFANIRFGTDSIMCCYIFVG